MSSGSRKGVSRGGKSAATASAKPPSAADLNKAIAKMANRLDGFAMTLIDIQESINHMEEVVAYLQDCAITKDDLVTDHDDDDATGKDKEGENEEDKDKKQQCNMLSKQRKMVLIDLINSEHTSVRKTVEEEFGKQWKANIEQMESCSGNNKSKEGRGIYQNAIDLAKDDHTKLALQS